MTKLPKDGQQRIVKRRFVFPKIIEGYRSGWFEIVRVRQIYSNYGEFGYWVTECFVGGDGNDLIYEGLLRHKTKKPRI